MILNKKTLWVLLIFASGCNSVVHEKDFLREVSKNLDQIKSASYFSTGIASVPEDTAEFTEPRKTYYKIFVNSSDTFVGSCSATFSADDTTKMTDFYDGKVRGWVYWDKQYVRVDSFQNHPYPFRLVYYPFYTKINEIIKYSLTTKDSTQTFFKDYGDSVFFSLKIINQHVYFHIKPIKIQDDLIPKDEISQFDIWFHKKDHMPYRMRSKWYHSTYIESCSDVKLNFKNNVVFHANEYYPAYFEIVQFKREQRKQENNLVGQKAPDWTLKDINSKDVKSANLKSKVLLVQFTGIGCGHCHHSIPFLKQLAEDYKEKDFELISIETWGNDIERLKRYQQKNGFNYRFLKSTDEVTKSYNVSAVPVFFIIDENRIIRKVINGYDKGNTDNEIIKNIEKLL